MLSGTKPGRLPYGGRARRLILGPLCLGLALASSSLVALGTGTASGATQGAKTKIATRDCGSTSCLITLTVTATLSPTPTGTVTFLLAGSPIPATEGGTCFSYALTALTRHSASATCDAAGLLQGRHKITVTYSGSTYLDFARVTKTIVVKGGSST